MYVFDEMDAPYISLGSSIAQARLAAGLATQRDLALRLEMSQQSVSRWEAGTHRPKLEQLPALAALLGLNTSDLRVLAGYSVPAITSATAPFPLEQLAPEEFEQFVAHLAEGLFPHAQVRRAGSSGHDQAGVDVVVRCPSGEIIAIQCKRVRTFGPEEVRAAAAAITAQADRHILALSRVVSPAAAASAEAVGFEVWDRDDISRRIRLDLSPPAQERLVDIFFRGQRQALLGLDEPGAWMSPSEFFSPFMVPERGFSHAWPLVGRRDDITALSEAVTAPEGGVTLLVAPGGMGKTRILAALVEELRDSGLSPFFLSATAEIKRADLQRLGPSLKFLVVDDAHDQDGLGALFEFAAEPSRQTRILLATRPYAVERIAGELAVSGLPAPRQVVLEPLGVPQLTEIARGVLERFGRPTRWAEAVVNGAGASPLVAIMAARIIGRDAVAMEKARSDVELRALILDKFERVLVGDLGAGGDEAAVRKVLQVLALVQPFHPEDRSLLTLIESVTGITADVAVRAMRLLLEGGVAYQRGRRCRLMPDVLGDYIIDRHALDHAGRLSPFAEAVLASASGQLLTSALINLGRLDWRRSDGDTTGSALLDSAWRRFDTIVDHWDERLHAVKALAFYQPHQAFDFAARQVRRGHLFEPLPEILRNVAFGSGRLAEAGQLLWEMARRHGADRASENPPMRALKELCGFHPHRSLAFPKQSLEFGMALVERDEAWNGVVTPLDVLDALLATEELVTWSEGRHFSFSSYFVDYPRVAEYRRIVIDKILDLLCDPRLHVSFAAAEHLEACLRGPIGRTAAAPPEGFLERYDPERLETLCKLEAVVRAGVHPRVAVAVDRAIRWRARSADVIGRAVERVLEALPCDLDYDLRDVLVSGGKDRFLHDDPEGNWDDRVQAWLRDVAARLVQAVPDAKDRLKQIEALVIEGQVARSREDHPYFLVFPTLWADPALAELMLSEIVQNRLQVLRPHANLALAVTLATDKVRGRQWLVRLASSGEKDLAYAAARGWAQIAEPNDDDVRLLAPLASHVEVTVAVAALQSLSWSALEDRRKAMALAQTEIVGRDKVADEVASALIGGDRKLVAQLDIDAIERLLEQLTAVLRFDGYWVDKLLAEISFSHPDLIAAFLRHRAELAANRNDYSMRAANTGPYVHTSLRILETPRAEALFHGMWSWMRDHWDQGLVFRHAALDVVEAMFLEATDLMARFAAALLPRADALDLRLISEMIRRADHDFVFQHTELVVALLERCEALDVDLTEEVRNTLYFGASEGMRSGNWGEPYPRDVEDRARAKAVLERLSIMSPAYELFDDIRRSAEENIKRSLRNAELLEDE
jgi:transcriptional regulator with XRE-family HTH domain